MRALKPRKQHGPEWIIQQEIIKLLRSRDWFVKVTNGNAFQTGLPDLYCVHREHGQRWIEVKNPKRYRFTAAQKQDFPIIGSVVGIWVLVAATEAEYSKLFLPQNWWSYL